jgi:hypothetical protein
MNGECIALGYYIGIAVWLQCRSLSEDITTIRSQASWECRHVPREIEILMKRKL